MSSEAKAIVSYGLFNLIVNIKWKLNLKNNKVDVWDLALFTSTVWAELRCVGCGGRGGGGGGGGGGEEENLREEKERSIINQRATFWLKVNMQNSRFWTGVFSLTTEFLLLLFGGMY